MRRSLVALLTLLCGVTFAAAQSFPPASITVDTTQTPEVMQALDPTGIWTKMGTFDTIHHTFSSNGGNAMNGIVNVTDAAIGMIPNTGVDNSQFIANLNTALSGPVAGGSSYEAVIPGIPGTASTSYYFAQPLALSKIAKYYCSAPLNGGVFLYFAAGVNGIEQIGQGGRGSFIGCNVRSLGYGTSIANSTSNTINKPSQGGGAGAPATVWHVGDSFISSAGNRFYPDEALPVFAPGTVVTSINSDGSMVMSDKPSPFWGANVVSFGGQPAPARGTAVFTETGTNNFVSGDKIKIANVTYTFTAGTNVGIANTPNQVAIGLNFQQAAANLTAAVNLDIGEFVGYVPNNPGGGGSASSANALATAKFDGNYSITFTSNYGGPGVNTLASTYTPIGTAAGSFANPTFTGADDETNCPSPCLKLSGAFTLWQLPGNMAAHISSSVGNYVVAWQQQPLPATQWLSGEKIWTDAFPWGSTLSNVRPGSIFQQTGGNNFINGDVIVVGNNTFTFRTALTAAAGDVKIGADFAHSSANLAEALANAPATDRGVIFNPPTNVSNVTLAGGVNPTWLTFYGFVLPSATTDAYPSTYTAAGTPAGSFLSPAFNVYRAAQIWQPGAGVQLATVTHPPGSETPMWLMYAGLKRMNASFVKDNSFTTWPIGEWGACSSGFNGANCDLARDENNFHQLDFVGRWMEGNNYATASAKDNQYSVNYVADYIGGGTLGEALFNENYESGESSTSKYGGLKFCGSQNHTTLFGGYITGLSGCTDPVHIVPASAAGGIDTVGMNNGLGQGRNLWAPGIGDVCCGPISFWSGNDLGHRPHGMFVGIGSPTAVNETVLTWDINFGSTPSVWYLAYNNPNKEYVWGEGIGSPGYVMKFLNSASATYSGSSGNFGINFPVGASFGGDGNGSNITGSRLIGTSPVKPTGLFHRQGDTEINTVSIPGGPLGWYSVGGSSSFNGRISDGTGAAPGTHLDVYNKLVTSPLPTVINGGSGYVASPGPTVANKSGSIQGTFANCPTEPTLLVTASGVTGAITGVNSVTIAGQCVGIPVDAPWNIVGGLDAGTGVTIRYAWTPAITTGVLGAKQVLNATSSQFTGTLVGAALTLSSTDPQSGSPSIGDTITGIADATFTGTITGTTLTMPSITTGKMVIGATILGTGVSGGTVVVSGSGLSWQVNISQTVGPVAMHLTGSVLAATKIVSGVSPNFVVNNSHTIGPMPMTTTFNDVHIVSGAGNSWIVDQPKLFTFPIALSGQSWYPFGGISFDPVLNDHKVDVLRSGVSTNNDLTGRVTLVAGSKTQTLAGTYNSANPPNCLCAQVPTGAGVAATDACTVFADATVTPAILTFTGTGTDTVKYICVGRN